MKSQAEGQKKGLAVNRLLGRMIHKPFTSSVVVILGFVSSLLLSFFVYLQLKSIESLKINRLGAVLLNALSPRMNLFGFSTMLFLAIMAAFMFAITFNKNLPYFKLLNMLGWKWSRINRGILLHFMSSYTLGYGLALFVLFAYVWFGKPEGAKYFDFLRPFLSASVIALSLMVIGAIGTVLILLIKANVLGKKTISVGVRNAILTTLAVVLLGLGAWQLAIYIRSHTPEQSQTVATVGIPTATVQGNEYLSNLVNYDLQLSFNPEKNLLSGKAWINLTNTYQAPLNEVVLNLYPNALWALATPSDTPYMEVRQVKVDGEVVPPGLEQSNTVLIVPLAMPLGEDQKLSLEMDYTLRLEPVETEQGTWWSSKALTPVLAVYDRQGWRTDVCSYCEDIFFSDPGSYHLSLSHPSDLQLISNANLIGFKPGENGMITSELEGILLRELFIGLSEEFTVASEEGEGFRIQVATLNDQDAASSLVARAAEILAFYPDKIASYPYDLLTLLASPSSASGGLAFSGGAELFYKSDFADLDPVLAELIAMQWWSEAVGVDFFQAPWQSESLNIFSAWQYLRALPDGSQFEAAKGKAETQATTLPLSCSLTEDISQGVACFTSVRNKGPLAWFNLEEGVGEDKVLAALKTYFQTCQGKICSPQVLVDLIHTEASYDFSTFLNE